MCPWHELRSGLIKHNMNVCGASSISGLQPLGVAARSTNRRGTVCDARPVQSVGRKALNLVAVGSCPTVGPAFAQQPDRVRTTNTSTHKTNRRAKGKRADTNTQRVHSPLAPPPSGAVTPARAKLNRKGSDFERRPISLSFSPSLWQRRAI